MDTTKECIRVAVIMAGGSGERFWPLSRRDHPKQLLNLTHDTQNMLQEAVGRIAPLIPVENIIIATGEHLVAPIQASGVGVPDENVIAEPCKRNTAGCLIYAAAHAVATRGGTGSNISMAVITADHLIGDPERFRQTVDVSLRAAEEHGVLATHGIVPTRPETGYGYIQASDEALDLSNNDGIAVFPVVAFHEKPNQEKAQDFISTGNYYWNGGMFFWRVDAFLEALEVARPEMAKVARDITSAMVSNDKGSVRKIFEGLEDISIDYALMEHAKNVVVTRADYSWDDVGSWTSLDRTRSSDESGNVTHGNPILIDTENCIVYNDAGSEQMAVSVVGMKDVVVVVSRDAILVVPKDRTQDIRRAVQELRIRNARQV